MRLAFRLALAPPGKTLPPGDAAAPPAFELPQARLWTAAPVIELGGAGWIVGPLFRRAMPSGLITDLDPEECHAIVTTCGRTLLDCYWGGYVALLLAEDGTVSVLRDPSGMMPCYVQRGEGVVTLASDMTAIAARGQVAIDYRALARMFAGIDTIGRRTGIAGVEELLPGERLRVTSTRSQVEQAWAPWDHVTPVKGQDFEEAAKILGATIKDNIGTWSTCFDHILVGVSGGLDSSIVAAALGPRTPHLRCLTMVEPGTDGDERRYVGALIQKLGIHLDAPTYDLDAVNVLRPVLPHFPLPYAAHFFLAIAAEHRRIAIGEQVIAYFSGNGGDNVFCSLNSAAPFADRLLANGPGPGIIVTARDLADLTGSGMIEVARQGWARIRRRHGGHRVRRDLSGLGRVGVAAAMAEEDQHPWLTAPPGTLPGKAAHVAMLARAQKSIELYPRAAAPPQIAPLLSQPLVELCLSIPSWQWVRGGRDRAVARAAFAGILPDLLLERTTKGSPSGFIQRVYAAQGAAARSMLMGGRLVEAGLVDSRWLAQSPDGDWLDDGRHLRILTFAAAEAWIRWWTDPKDESH